MSESKPDHFEILLILAAFAAGSVDIISFAKLGGIFASAMTGNLALLGLYVGRGAIFSVFGALMALLGFIAGVSMGTLLTRDRLNQKAITILLAVQTLLLFAAAILWFLLSHRAGGLAADLLILILAGAMGLQAVTGKKINLSSIPTIVFTSTLTNIVVSVTEHLARGKFSLQNDTKRQMASFCSYFAGAVIAGLLSFFNFGIVITLPLAVVAMSLLIQIRKIRIPEGV
jgi:uncharacterized membrane protein YoaK (UPF0700 family)